MSKKQEKIVGIRALEEAIERGTSISKVFLQRGKGEERQKFISPLKASGIPFQWVPKEKLNKMYSGNHQGVLAFVSPITFYQLDQWLPALFEEGKVPAIGLLDGITDVRNFGAIARSAECLGMDGLVIPFKGSVTITEDAVKASSGALLNLPVCREPDLTETVHYLKKSGLRIIGVSEKGSLRLAEADLTTPLAFVLGAEDQGIGEKLRIHLDAIVNIPMTGGIESLNVSVSAGIVFYEMLRQRLD